MSESNTMSAADDRSGAPAGYPNLVRGSRKGIPNNSTRDAKLVASMLAEQLADDFCNSLRLLFKDNPTVANSQYLELLKIVLPQRAPLMSATFQQPDGQPSAVEMRVRAMFTNQIVQPAIESTVDSAP